jgi:hypothetical protein
MKFDQEYKSGQKKESGNPALDVLYRNLGFYWEARKV